MRGIQFDLMVVFRCIPLFWNILFDNKKNWLLHLFFFFVCVFKHDHDLSFRNADAAVLYIFYAVIIL